MCVVNNDLFVIKNNYIKYVGIFVLLIYDCIV